MIFEALIIVSAAAIFVILARRLPETNESGGLVSQTKYRSFKYDFKRLSNPITGILKKIPKPNGSFLGMLRKDNKANQKQHPVNTFLSAKNTFKTITDLTGEADDFFAGGDLRSAEKLYLKVASKAPRDAKIYSRLGAIYLQQKNYSDARDAFLAAINIDGKIASRHYNLALSYIGLSTLLKARVSLKKAIDLDPKEKYKKTLETIEQKTK